jgi:hypothetical protein
MPNDIDFGNSNLLGTAVCHQFCLQKQNSISILLMPYNHEPSDLTTCTVGEYHLPRGQARITYQIKELVLLPGIQAQSPPDIIELCFTQLQNIDELP